MRPALLALILPIIHTIIVAAFFTLILCDWLNGGRESQMLWMLIFLIDMPTVFLALWIGEFILAVLPLEPSQFFLNVYFPAIATGIGGGVQYYLLSWGFWHLVKRRHERKLKRPPICPKCKYDLRGGDANACPECGWRRNQGAANWPPDHYDP